MVGIEPSNASFSKEQEEVFLHERDTRGNLVSKISLIIQHTIFDFYIYIYKGLRMIGYQLIITVEQKILSKKLVRYFISVG